jgi:LuxR family maltose regulon positive regulatory protein
MSSELIPRARLLERLNAGLGGKVTLVCAPAGFGKTTLLAQWVEMISRPTAWLSLEVGDDDLAIFVRTLAEALRIVCPDAFASVASLLQATQLPALDSLVALFSNNLADMAEDILLVLDDCHRIRSSQILSFLEQLVEHLPDQVHLALSSRSDPQLPLARWLALGHLHELRGSDLRFSSEETEAFLARELGSVVAHEVAGALAERTGGWCAVLRLAAISLRNTADQELFLERLGQATERTISSYLVEEVLSQLEPAMLELLEQASLFEQFCAGLCRAIMGNESTLDHVQAALEWLDHSHLFLVSLDARQGWFRFHHLFQGLLQQRLQERLGREELALLHRRASAWFAEQGLLEEALEHALVGEDARGATRMVEAHFLRAFEQEQWVQLDRWMRLLPEEQILCSPALLIARAWVAQARGKFTDLPPLLAAAEQVLESNDSGALEAGNRQSGLLRALIKNHWSSFQYFTGQVEASWQNSRSALELIPPGEERIANVAFIELALASMPAGQADSVLAQLQQALRERSTNPKGTAHLLTAQGVLYLDAGKLHHAAHTARHLLQIGQEGDLALSQNYAHWLLGVAHYEWDRLDEAVYHFSAVVANQHRAHFVAVLDSMCGLALAYQAMGLTTQAQGTAHALLTFMQEQRNMGGVLAAYAFLGRLALLRDDVDEAMRWLELAGPQEAWRTTLLLDDPSLTRARLLLTTGDPASVAEGQALLTQLLHSVQVMHSTRKTIQVLALQVWAYDLQDRENDAREVLEHALDLGRHGGFVRTFAGLPPLLKVLAELRRYRKARNVPATRLDTYLQDILVAISPASAYGASPKELMRQEGLEPLTERELQILHLLEKGFTNREIASKLVVTSGTVKLHTKHVYRKLSVNNRQTAVTLARSLGLLAVD